MTFSIHGTKVTDYDPMVISAALKNVPIDVPSNQTTEGFSLDQTQAVTEEEYAYADLSAKDPTRFFGTSRVGDCLVLYIYNDSGERCLVHHTPQHSPNWEAIFREFRNKNVKIAIWGGRPIDPQPAIASFSSILANLINFAKTQPEVKIDIVRHRFAAYNAPKKEEMAQAVTHFLHDRLHFGFQRHLQQHFERKLNYKDPTQNFADSADSQEDVESACRTILLDPLNWHKTPGWKATAKTLHELAKVLFTKQAFLFLSKAFVEHKMMYLTNFVVNLETHRVFPCLIPPKPKDMLREAYLFSKAMQTQQDYSRVLPHQPLFFPESFIRLCHNWSRQGILERLQSSKEIDGELLTAFRMQRNEAWLEKLRHQTSLVDILTHFRKHYAEFAVSPANPLGVKLHQEESLRLAAVMGLADKVRQLIQEGKQSGLDVNASDHLTRTALHFAVMRRERVQDHLTKDNLARFNLPATYSIDNCLKGHAEVVQALCQAQADCNVSNVNQLTPLKLIERDLESKDRTPLEIEVAKKCADILRQNAAI